MFTLTIFADTSLIDTDLQPNYVRVTMKEKILQLALNDEISTDNSTAQRSQTTGHLVITMPKLKYILEGKCSSSRSVKTATTKKTQQSNNRGDSTNGKSQISNRTKEVESATTTVRDIERSVERLEVSSDKDKNDNNKKKCDYANIVKGNDENKNHGVENGDNSFIFTGKRKTNGGMRSVSVKVVEDDDFVDNPDVPPLE